MFHVKFQICKLVKYGPINSNMIAALLVKLVEIIIIIGAYKPARANEKI